MINLGKRLQQLTSRHAYAKGGALASPAAAEAHPKQGPGGAIRRAFSLNA